MNVFTTDHPLTSQPSYFDAKAHPRLSFIFQTFVSAVLITPLIFGCLVYYAVSEDAQSTDETDWAWSLSDLAIILALIFIFSFIFSFLLLLTWRLIKRCVLKHKSSAHAPLN
jgi:hypothetical protein